MKTISATEAKSNFGKCISIAMMEPISITKSGCEAVVMLSKEEYERLEAIDDYLWMRKAIEAKKGGFLGVEAGQKIIEKFMNAQT